MINLGIIGLGTIFHWQYEAILRQGGCYRVSAVYDTDVEHAKSCTAHTDLKVSHSIEELLADETIRAVVIITPPKTHTELAKKCLYAGKHVLLEKPATLDLGELDELYKVAKEKGVLFKIAYHASFALDLEWYLNNQQALQEKYGLGELTKIECGFYDPYTRLGTVMPEKYALCGSFIDSAVNALSVCAKLVNLESMELISKVTEEENGIVYKGDAEYDDGTHHIIVRTAWDLGLNQKTTELSFADSDKKITLHHSNQSVILEGKNFYKILYENKGQERLLNHYLGVYRDFYMACERFENVRNNEQCDEHMTRNIHRLLL